MLVFSLDNSAIHNTVLFQIGLSTNLDVISAGFSLISYYRGFTVT